jgi:hypothetical protein
VIQESLCLFACRVGTSCGYTQQQWFSIGFRDPVGAFAYRPGDPGRVISEWNLEELFVDGPHGMAPLNMAETMLVLVWPFPGKNSEGGGSCGV